MAIFEYHALTPAGRLMRGTLEAASNEQAGKLLREMQLTVQSILEAKVAKPKTAIGRNEFILFNEQLASITQAGIPLEKGLRELSADINSAAMRRMVNEIADDLENGVSIQQAFKKREKHFPPLYGSIIEAGVQTGRLSEMLISLNRHLETTGHTRRILFEALCYPAVILLLAAIIVSFFLLMLTPQFEAIYLDFDIELPEATYSFLQMGNYVIQAWGCGGIALFFVFFFWWGLGKFKEGRYVKESIVLRIPVFGRIYRLGTLCRLADSLALTIGAGCDIPQSLRLAGKTLGSEKLSQECRFLADQIDHGSSIMESGQVRTTIPRLFLYSMQLGIQRNELQDNLFNLTDMYSSQVRYCQGRLSAILLPIVLILVAGFIGMGIIAMFLPFFGIFHGVQA
jgi:type IV pilus assembly protein PilC